MGLGSRHHPEPGVGLPEPLSISRPSHQQAWKATQSLASAGRLACAGAGRGGARVQRAS